MSRLCLERALGSRAGDAATLEAIDADSLLVGRGPSLARLRVSAGDLAIVGWVPAPGGVDALRVDHVGQRAYAVTGGGERVFDVRGGGLTVAPGAPAAVLAHWIRRRDVGDLSLRLGTNGLHLARVSR